jgi:hypothetical protein
VTSTAPSLGRTAFVAFALAEQPALFHPEGARAGRRMEVDALSLPRQGEQRASRPRGGLAPRRFGDSRVAGGSGAFPVHEPRLKPSSRRATHARRAGARPYARPMIEPVPIAEDERWIYRAAALNLRLNHVGRPMTPAVEMMVEALDDIAAGRPPRMPELPMPGSMLRLPARHGALQSDVMLAVAIGFASAGIGFAALAACALVEGVP